MSNSAKMAGPDSAVAAPELISEESVKMAASTASISVPLNPCEGSPKSMDRPVPVSAPKKGYFNVS